MAYPFKMKKFPIMDRIRSAYRQGIHYHDLMRAVFPDDRYPRAWRYSSNGGPPGCAMAFGRALRKMGASWDIDKTVYLPREK